MAYVSVPKDLTKVKTKLALNLTKRQLIGFTIAALIGFPVYLLARKALPNDISMLIMIGVAFPIIFTTLFQKDGIYFEKYLKYMIDKKRQASIRIYKTECIYDVRRKKKRKKGKE
ncbi:MAG: PrgI family protein [Tissierellia bacterium]|nr:PrgI family protein [Tissierellia bacterium]